LNARATQDATRTRIPMTIKPATLAPTTVEVRSCHAGPSSGSSSRSPVTGTDSSRGRGSATRSVELADDLAGEQLQVVEVGHVEQLQVHPLHPGFGEGAQSVDDLVGRARQR
jgi:hypothetical protein